VTGAPRNRPAFEAGQRNREAIRRLMLEHAAQFPLARSLTAAQIRLRLRRLGIYLAASTVYWHVEHIRLAADLAVLEAEDAERYNSSNSSTTPDAA
jgi:hypothetical protein